MDFKRYIEDKLLTSKRMLWMYKEFRGFDDTQLKHLNVKIKKLKIDTGYDLDECIVTIISEEPIGYHTQIKTVIDSMKKLEGKDILKVFNNDVEVIAKEEVSHITKITFTLLNSVEK